MGKTLIRVDCVDQRLYISTAPMLASGGRNEDQIEFGFCSLWDGFEKTAVFYREKDDVYHAIITDDRCIIPHEVLTDEGWLYFGVLGVKGDITRTSAIMRYRIEAGAITEGTNPSDPTPDIYAQYIARIQAIEQMFNSEPFSVTGNPVEIDNYGSAPMHVKTTVALNQSGEGDPSSENPRPISVVDRFILTHTGADSENKHMSAPVGNMAEGTFDFSTGQMVTTMVWREFDGSADENIVIYERENLPYGFRFECKFNLTANTSKRDQSRCNRARYVVNLLANFQRDTYSISSEGDRIVYMPPEAAGNTVDSFRAWLAENPLQIAYIPAEIITANKVPTPIYAFDGLNTISVNHGTLTVEGEKSLPAAVGGLAERVTELEENGGVNGSWVAGVSSIEGKDGDLTLADIGAASQEDVDRLSEEIDNVGSAGVPENVKSAIYQLLAASVSTEEGMAQHLAVVQAWAGNPDEPAVEYLDFDIVLGNVTSGGTYVKYWANINNAQPTRAEMNPVLVRYDNRYRYTVKMASNGIYYMNPAMLRFDNTTDSFIVDGTENVVWSGNSSIISSEQFNNGAEYVVPACDVFFVNLGRKDKADLTEEDIAWLRQNFTVERVRA